MTSSRYWCELAWVGDRIASDVLIDVDAVTGRFVAVTMGVAAADAGPDAIRLPGLSVPGLANAHSHAFHRALRGRTHGGAGSFWTWREEMYRIAARLDPDTYRSLARATFAEMVLAGVTSVGEFHYVHHQPDGRPYDDPNELGLALLAAAADAGLRITLLDTLYLRGGIGPDGYIGLSEQQRRFGDGDVDAWADRVAGLPASDSIVVGAAVHSVRAVDPAAIGELAAWATGDDRPIHAHVSEQPAENDQCRAVTGRSPVAVFADAGLVDGRFTAVHATHVDDADAAALGDARSFVCCCPTTERDLADGIGPMRRLVDRGAAVCLGSDSHAVIDLFEEARAVELDERLATGQRGSHDVSSLLRMATADGQASLGWADAGVIAPGGRADLVTIRLDSVRLAGTSQDSAAASVVFAATASDVHHVVVDGRVVVRDGRHVSIDVARELATSIAAVVG